MALDRLINQLNNSGLQQKDMPLYQVIAALIRELKRVANSTGNGGGGGGSSSIVNITNVHQFLDLGDSGSGGDGEIGPPGIPGSNGADGANGMVPYFIASDETFTVPEFKQALFSMNIDNEGILDVEGFLIEVD